MQVFWPLCYYVWRALCERFYLKNVWYIIPIYLNLSEFSIFLVFSFLFLFFFFFFVRCIACWWPRRNKYLCCQHCFFFLRYQLMWSPLLTWNLNHVPRNFVHIPGNSDTWNCFSSVLYCLAYLHFALISRHFSNCSFFYLIGTPSPITFFVSPNLLYSSFLRWSSL